MYFEIVIENGQVKSHNESPFTGITGFTEVVQLNNITVNTHTKEIIRQELTGYDEEGNPIFENVAVQNVYYTYTPAFLQNNSVEIVQKEIDNLTSQVSSLSSELSSSFFLESTIGGLTKAQFLSKYATQLSDISSLQSQIATLMESISPEGGISIAQSSVSHD